jgi:bifunctional DNA-binding transcriptional regulator/antitoxin component of YhaV-PrlF toxin-antitoxin module
MGWNHKAKCQGDEKMSKLTSKVSYVKKGSLSLKTTIPSFLSQLLDLKHGDTVEWDIETRKGKKVLILKKE